MELLRSLGQYLESCSGLFKSTNPVEYKKAKAFYDEKIKPLSPSVKIEEGSESECFEFTRLTANVCHEPRQLCDSVDSAWVMLTAFGSWAPRSGQGNGQMDGSLHMPLVGQTVKARPDDITVVRGGIPVGVRDFMGERYQVELFLPKMGEGGQ
jgi:hypothetical protein